jgi:CheY-like chemotaxis protein
MQVFLIRQKGVFCHANQAFTGDGAGRKGLFRAASGGSLFLDDITEIPPCGATVSGPSGTAHSTVVGRLESACGRGVPAKDNPESAEVTSDYLRSKGYSVRNAGSGRDALEGLREAPTDLALMDVQMRDMDGREAIRQIRVDPDIRFAPIIAITALAMAGDRDRCLAAGANAYMSKPLRLRSLIESVESFLSQLSEA